MWANFVCLFELDIRNRYAGHMAYQAQHTQLDVKFMSGPLLPIEKPGSPIASPCVRNCCLDESDICMGCGRHIEEILVWSQASNETRLEILELSRQRLIEKANRFRSPDS
jgi:predicted Fe-S protein YdhL (DUF1289 family)